MDRNSFLLGNRAHKLDVDGYVISDHHTTGFEYLVPDEAEVNSVDDHGCTDPRPQESPSRTCVSRPETSNATSALDVVTAGSLLLDLTAFGPNHRMTRNVHEIYTSEIVVSFRQARWRLRRVNFPCELSGSPGLNTTVPLTPENSPRTLAIIMCRSEKWIVE